MVVLTKEKALAYLLRMKRRNGISSSKATAIGMFRILIKKNLVTVADIVEEFPELDNVNFTPTIQEKQERQKFVERTESP